MNRNSSYILGAGVTGLAASYASGLTAFEASPTPGGICSSYYMSSGSGRRFDSAPSGEDAYRFEVGGGHWIFGGSPLALRFIKTLDGMERYARRAAVYLPDRGLFVPYPIQNHVRFLENSEAVAALGEILRPASGEPSATMAEWIDRHFGATLGSLFFHPFHELYTAGLWLKIAPQDPYKSPLDRSAVIKGAFDEAVPAGYNTTFLYPRGGLDTLARAIAAGGCVEYGKRVASVEPAEHTLVFEDGDVVVYDNLLSTLPLNQMVSMAGIALDEPSDPHTSVLVINIGAKRLPSCPDDHWVYVPRSKTGFHRVGFYSNVDESFLPNTARGKDDRVSIYVEIAYQGGTRPTDAEIETRIRATVSELQAWQWIGDVDVVDPTWIDVAYTWSWPNSSWRESAMRALASHGIYSVGRYGRWNFQGIADSIQEGLFAGAAVRKSGLKHEVSP